MYNFVKRFLDILLALIISIVLIPLFILISICIKIDSHGPILFRQTRTGKDGVDFELLKFRSMSKDNDVYDFKKGDKITRVGRVIRKTSLDELPQLLNIIKGDMSFIGPRPWLNKYYQYFTDFQKQRNKVRPGITGLAQVSGRKDLSIIQRIEYDVKYVNNINFVLDLKIVLQTIHVIFKKDNNTYENYTIEDEFNDLKENFKKTLKSN